MEKRHIHAVFQGRNLPDSVDWDKLKTFHAAARSGSLTRAAEDLGISQSAVSRQIAALEDRVHDDGKAAHS
ncbi:MAG: LysR family transcriptional regulator, partial [Pseudomonadota bacterium]